MRLPVAVCRARLAPTVAVMGCTLGDGTRPTVQEVLDRAGRRVEPAQESSVAALTEERKAREDSEQS
jgi:hypothetical protein